MKLEDALKQNPYDKTRGSKGAYIRYLRYTVDGWYSKKSEEIRKQIDWDKITKERSVSISLHSALSMALPVPYIPALS